MTEEEARPFIGKWCLILWQAHGTLAGMTGKVVGVEDDWVVVDYGYGAYLPIVVSIKEIESNAE